MPRCSTRAPPPPRRWPWPSGPAKSEANAFFVDRDTHPQTLGVVETRARAFGFEVIVGDPLKRPRSPTEVFGALLSYPGSSGEVRDFRAVIARLHAAGALAIMATDLLALALLTPPGELGADIAVGSAQRFGVPMGYRRPACRLLRHPRRVQARHARPHHRRLGRQPAASPPCAWRCRPASSISAARRRPATSAPPRCCSPSSPPCSPSTRARGHTPDRPSAPTASPQIFAAGGASASATRSSTGAFFDTVTLHVPGRARMLLAKAREKRINLRFVDADHLGISFDQTTRRAELERLLACFRTDALERIDIDAHRRRSSPRHLPEALRRTLGLSSPIRSSRSIIARPRCCATCAASRPRTSRSTAR